MPNRGYEIVLIYSEHRISPIIAIGAAACRPPLPFSERVGDHGPHGSPEIPAVADSDLTACDTRLWLGTQRDDAPHISALTVAKVWRGTLEQALGQRRRELQGWFAGPEGPQALFTGWLFAFNERAARVDGADG